MNYLKLYTAIVGKATSAKRVKSTGVYYELHHIKPKSLFPEIYKAKSNLVLLTPREHYVCHWLLTKIYPSKAMTFAFMLMCNKAGNSKIKRYYKVNSKVYENLKIEFGRNNPAKSKQAREKISKAKSGSKHHYYGASPSSTPGYKSDVHTLVSKTGDEVTGTRNFLYSNTNLTAAGVSNIITGYRQSSKGWRLKGAKKVEPKKGINSSRADLSFYCFYNKKTGVGYVCNRFYFIKKTGLKKRTVDTIICKQRNCAFGWSVTKL